MSFGNNPFDPYSPEPIRRRPNINKALLLPLAFCLSFASFACAAMAQERPEVRVAVLSIGTVNWELKTISASALDAKHGFRLKVLPYADNGATRIAVAGGEADMAVADWIWVARQRAAGKDYVFIPYSRAVGGLVVPADSVATGLTDLAKGKIGIAGGPLDKSWLILRAYALKEYGMDLKLQTEQVFGSPPIIYKSGLGGDFAGTINFWHFLAKMKASGMRELVSVEEAGAALGLDAETPLLGYFAKQSFFDANPGLAQSFFNASRDAKDLLANDDSAWEIVRPNMNASSDAAFEQLRADWIAGIPARGPVDHVAAAQMLAIMAELGGTDLVGEATTLSPGLFADVD